VSNQFAFSPNKMLKWFCCRVSTILTHSSVKAKKHGYAPIPSDTQHAVIRKMMDEPCWFCGGWLPWVLGQSTTPHLHHDHKTGEPLGFAHPRCHTAARSGEIDRLKRENEQLQHENERLRSLLA
jgi:hypothetical protein